MNKHVVARVIRKRGAVAVFMVGTCSVVPSQADVRTWHTTTSLQSMGRLGEVAVAGDSELYVSSFGSKVWRVHRSGLVETVADDFALASGNALMPNGALAQADFDRGSVELIGPDDSRSILVANLYGPVGVDVRAGRMMVCECKSNTIVELSLTGAVVSRTASELFDCPNGIKILEDGSAVITNFNNGTVVKVEHGKARRLVEIPGGRNAHVAAVGVDLFITQIASNRIFRVHDGAVTVFAGSGEYDSVDGDAPIASFAAPNGIDWIQGTGTLVVNSLEGTWRGDSPTKILLREVDLPADSDIERVRIKVGRLVFDAYAAGPLDGPLVLMLHGFPESGYAFRSQLRFLAARGYRVVAPNQRGYSAGARPRSVGDYAIGKLAQDVIDMADSLGRRMFHLAGHDWGGAVAWVVATRYPERVKSLTILSTPHFAALAKMRSEAGSAQQQNSAYFADFGSKGYERRLLADHEQGLRELLQYAASPEETEQYVSLLGTPAALRAALNWYAASVRPAERGRATPSQIKVPTVYLWGERDSVFARAAAEGTRDYVDAPYAFVPLEGVGHWLPERAADVVNRVLEDQLARSGSTELISEWKADRLLRAALLAVNPAGDRVDGYEFDYEEQGVDYGQSWDPDNHDAELKSGHYLLTADASLHAQAFVNGGGTDRSFVRMMGPDAGWNDWTPRDQLTPIDKGTIARLSGQPRDNVRLTMPHQILARAVASGGVWRGDDNGLAAIDVNVFGIPIPLGIDTGSGRLVSATFPVVDRLLGRASETLGFHDYEMSDGILVPARIDARINGALRWQRKISGFKQLAEVDATVLAPPGDFAPSVAPFVPRQVARGVYAVRLYSGPENSYNTMLVEFGDHWVVVEAPLNDAFFPVIQRIATSLANKPITAVVVTHHHHDHLGGVLPFARAGVEVYATGDAIAELQRMLVARQVAGGVDVKVRTHVVTDRVELADAQRKLVLLPVGPNPHAREMLVALVEEAGVLYVADLFAIPESGKPLPHSPTSDAFVAWLLQTGIGVTTIVPAHGLVGSGEDLSRYSL